MGPQEDYIETVLTCEGDYYDPDFHRGLEDFSQKLESLINADNGKFILKKVEPWNSVRVTFNIPKEAAVRLKQLAEQGDDTLKDLGILAVQIEGGSSISLTIAGKNNETTELIFRTTNGASSNPSVFDSSAEDLLSGPSDLEATRANIAECLRAQSSEAGPHLMSVFMRQQQPLAPPSVTIPTNQMNQPPLYGSPSRSPSHSASSVGSQLPVPPGKSSPGFPSPSQSVSQQSFPSPGSSRSQPSPVSPQYPTPPPSQPSHPSSPGIRSNSLAYTHHNPIVNNVQGLRLNKDVTSSSPLLVNLLQTEVAHQQQQHFNSIPQLPMPPPFDGGPAVKKIKRRRSKKERMLKVGPIEGEISVPGLPLPAGSDTRVPPIAMSDNFMQQSPSPLGDGHLPGLTSSLTAGLNQPSAPSSQQAHSWVRHASSPSQVSGNVTPPVVLPHNKNIRCSPDKPTNPQHIINPYTGQLEPVESGGVSADTKDFVIKTEASDTFGDVSSQLKPPPNPLVAIQQHMAASESSGQQHRVSSPSNTSSSIGNNGSFLGGLPKSHVPRLPPYPSSTKPKPLHRSGSPANAGGVSAAVGSVTLPGSTNTGSMGYSSVLSGLKRSNSGLFSGSRSSSPSSSQVPTTASNPRHRFSPVTSLTSPVSGSSSLVSTVSSVLSGEKNHLPDSRAIPNTPSDSQNRVRLNCSIPQAQSNSSVTQGISIPSDRSLTVTSVASQVANVMSYAPNSDNLSRSAACSPVQNLQKTRNIHSQSPTASLSLSVSQTLSAYPDRTLLLDSSSTSDLRPSSTPLSSRSSTPKIKSEHESVTAILNEAASHFIPIPKDNPENFIPNATVKVKEEPVSRESLVRDGLKVVTSTSGETLSNRNTSHMGHAGVQRTPTGNLWTEHHLKRLDSNSPSGASQDSGFPRSDSAFKSGTLDSSVVQNLPFRTATSLSGAVPNVSIASSSRPGQLTARPSVKVEIQEPSLLNEAQSHVDKSNNENAVRVLKQEIGSAQISEQSKNPGDNGVAGANEVKHQSNHHGEVRSKKTPSPHLNKTAMDDNHGGMNNIDSQHHSKDANNYHDSVSDRLFDGKLLDVPPLLNPDQGVGISSVTQSDLQTIPRGSNGASLGEASPLSSDNASSTGQPNAGQSPITNMIGHMNHDSELSSHSFEDHVALNSQETNNLPPRHNGGTSNKDRDSVPSQHPGQADHKNIITVGYAFAKDNPVDLNNGFTNDKLFKNLNNMSYLTKSFLDLENNDVKGVRISTDFLQKERINPGLVRHSSQDSDGERYCVKPSLMNEKHLNLNSCLSLPAKLLGKSDLNPGGLPVDKSTADAKINGSSPLASLSSVLTNTSECSINGSLSGDSHDNGLPSRKSPLSKDGSEAPGRNENEEEEKDHKSIGLAQTVMIISPTSIRTPEKLVPNHIVSKNESLPSSHATVWAGSRTASQPASDGEPGSVEQTADLMLSTGSSTDNLASSRTVITAASSSTTSSVPLLSTEAAKGKEESCQGSSTEGSSTTSHQKVPSSLPSLIPADKSTGPGLLSSVQSQITSGKTNGLGCNAPEKNQEVSLNQGDMDNIIESKMTVDGLHKTTTPNGDHPGLAALSAHHNKTVHSVQSKGISILKPLHDREEEGDDDLLYSTNTDKMKSLSESLVIAGHATQDSPHKAHSNIVIGTVLGEEDKAGKDVVKVSMPLVGSPHSKAVRSNSYSKSNPKSSFNDFPNNASRLASFVSKSIHAPVHNSASHTITAPGFHLNLTESVQRVIPSMDTLSPPHDKATFSLTRMNQSPVNLSPPAVEKKSPTQKVHSGSTTPESLKNNSGKVTPELAASEDLSNDHHLAMAQRTYARTTATVVSTQGSKTVTTVPSSLSEQTSPSSVASVASRTISSVPEPPSQTVVEREPVAENETAANLVLPTAGSSSVSPVNTITSTGTVTTNVSSTDDGANGDLTDSGPATETSPALDLDSDNADSVTVTTDASASLKLDTEDVNQSLEKTQTVSVAANKTDEIVPLKPESVNIVESVVPSVPDCTSKSPTESKVETSPAKTEVVARQSRRLQARMEHSAHHDQEESGPGRPARIRKYSTESIKSEASEALSEGMSTRSGRMRRASTESSKSVDEQGRSSRMTRCGSRESAESRSGSRESHGKEESPKGTTTRNRKTSGSSEDLVEERKIRLGELRTSTPSPTPRATRTSTRSVRKKIPEGFVDTTTAIKPSGDTESTSKTRGSKRRLAMDDHSSEIPSDKKAKGEEAAGVTEGKGNAKGATGPGNDSVASSVANRVRGKQDTLRTPVKDPVTPQKVSPSKENVADEHSYSNKKPGKAKPVAVVKKPPVVEQKPVVGKTRQTGRCKSPIPELSGRNRSCKQPVVEEKVTTTATTSAPPAIGTATPGPVKRSTRSTRTKEAAEAVNTPSAAGKRRRVSRDQR